MLLLAFYLGLYVAIFSFLVRFTSETTKIPLILRGPIIWTALEYGRAHFLTGFPWSLLGYSQYQNLIMIQIADITSVYGVSFLIIMVNSLILQWTLFFFNARRNLKTFFPWATTGLTLLVILFTLLYGYFKLTPPQQKDPSVTVALVQGNIPQDQKWDLTFQEKTMEVYLGLTREETRQPTDLVIWPEAATPFLFNQHPEFQEKILRLAKNQSTPLLFGSPTITRGKDTGPVLFNSAYLVSSDGEIKNRYDKIHLVPFGEYVPLSFLLSFVNKMVTGIGDFMSGKTYTVMEIQKATFGTVICFEVIFPELTRQFVAQGAQMMTTITNDAWFGYSSAPYQHFSMVVFRAIENRVPFARAANTGISGFINSQGKILSTTALFERTTLRESLFLKKEKTFYTQQGDIFAAVCVIMLFLLILNGWIHTSKKKGMPHHVG